MIVFTESCMRRFIFVVRLNLPYLRIFQYLSLGTRQLCVARLTGDSWWRCLHNVIGPASGYIYLWNYFSTNVRTAAKRHVKVSCRLYITYHSKDVNIFVSVFFLHFHTATMYLTSKLSRAEPENKLELPMAIKYFLYCEACRPLCTSTVPRHD